MKYEKLKMHKVQVIPCAAAIDVSRANLLQ